MMSAKKIASTSLPSEFQPYISVAVSISSTTKEFTLGILFVNTGVAISLVSKKWCNLYELTIKMNSGATINSAFSEALDIVGTASMVVVLAPTLKVDLGEVAVSLEDFY